MTPIDPTTDDAAQFVETQDGRRLAYAEFGAADGRPVIYCHGFPSSRREAMLLHRNAIDAGARIIAPDRPGYGDSDPAPERGIADWGEDVAHLADRLQLRKFGLIGVSGGGPYALACAASIPQRIAGCALICPLGPIYIDEVLRQMGLAVRTNLMIGKQPAWLGDLMFGGHTTSLLQRWPNLVEDIRSIAAPAADRAVLADNDTSALLNQTIADAMRNGAPGARRDLTLYTHDWQLNFADIKQSISIWHGTDDGTVPIEHARWYADHLPNVDLVEIPNEGHYSVPVLFSTQILMHLLGTGANDPSTGN
ncbi:MAG: alpha/beta hydrolase [Thiohalocapsa sp.]